VGELFVFHVVLVSKGMTTYDYIIAQREKQALEGGVSRGAEALDDCKSVVDCISCKHKKVRLRGKGRAHTCPPPTGVWQ